MVNTDNPFSDYGKIMAKGRFIGRDAETRRLQQRVLSNHGGGCAAIVGEARIGKTSLMHHVFSNDDPLVRSVNGLVVDFNIGGLHFNTIVDFFVAVVKGVQRNLRRISKPDSEDTQIFAQEFYQSAEEQATDWNIVLLEYFQEVAAKRYRIILLLDEFDSITRVFGNNEAAFQLLRQLGYDERYGTSIVTTSRISIGQIEVESLISTLSGIFTDIHVGLFCENEFEDLMNSRLQGNPFRFTKAEKQGILNFCGLHPYYVQIAAFHLWDKKTSQNLEALTKDQIENALDLCREEIYEQFDNCKLRMGQSRFEVLLAVTLGPSAISFSQLDVNRLLQQGHIVTSASNGETYFEPFSTVYREYLQYHQRTIDLWPLWNETEGKLRELIANRYSELAKKERIPLYAFLKEKHSKLYEKYREYQNEQQREQRYFSATTSPFDYMNPGDIFAFLEENWLAFQDIFGAKDKLNAWSNKFEVLRRVRNPYAHSRNHAVTEMKRKEAENICNEILAAISKTTG